MSDTGGRDGKFDARKYREEFDAEHAKDFPRRTTPFEDELQKRIADLESRLAGEVQKQCACEHDGSTVKVPCVMHEGWAKAQLAAQAAEIKELLNVAGKTIGEWRDQEVTLREIRHLHTSDKNALREVIKSREAQAAEIQALREALRSFAHLGNWEEYRGSLGPHFYWKGKEREPWRVAEAVLKSLGGKWK